ncbi:lipase family protein [Williamsia sp. SKLECPSW1]
MIALALCAATALTSVACSDDPAPTTAVRSPIPVTPSLPPAPADRGTIVTATPLTDATPALAQAASQAVRATYVSTDPRTAAEVRVTGAFFLPRTAPPTGGWPVISFAHGTTGTSNGCGLSQSPDLRGYAGTVVGLLTAGYAVAATDYRGLGPDGVHLYLDPLTAAFDVIDAARALHRLAPTTSTRWLAYGDSQGGQAVWAAAEQQGDYGAGLTMVGALATKPAANVTALAQLAADGDLSMQQRTIAAMVALGAARASDGRLTVAQVLPAIPAATVGDLVGCDAATRTRALQSIGPDGFAPAPDAVGAYTTALQRDALPQRRSTVPIRVVYGLADQLIPPDWVTTPIAQACAEGSQVSPRAVPGKGHGDTLLDDSDLRWVVDRFAGRPVTDACP